MNKLEHSIVNLDGRLLETYSRETYATQEAKDALGLDSTENIISNVGVAPLPEFVALEATSLGDGDSVSWGLSRVGQSVMISSVIIDSPNQDGIKLEILNESGIEFSSILDRTQTPYTFPENPLKEDRTIKVTALAPVAQVKITLKPVIILETLQPDPPINNLENLNIER